MSNRSLMILIAGPYRSGTGDDPELMARNLRELESVALPLYRAGTFHSSENGLLSRSFAKPGRFVPETLSTMRFCIQSPIDCSVDVTLSCGSRALPRVLTKM